MSEDAYELLRMSISGLWCPRIPTEIYDRLGMSMNSWQIRLKALSKILYQVNCETDNQQFSN